MHVHVYVHIICIQCLCRDAKTLTLCKTYCWPSEIVSNVHLKIESEV